MVEPVTKTVSVAYSCSCGQEYASEADAANCSVPKEHLYMVGEWVETNKPLSMANPAYDDGFGDEAPYDALPESSVGRISGVQDRHPNFARHPKQSYSYHFDRGDWLMISHPLQERNLRPVDKQKFQERIKQASRELKQLEDIAKELG